MPSEDDWEVLEQAAGKYYADVLRHKWLCACWIELWKAIKHGRGLPTEDTGTAEDAKINGYQLGYTGLAEEQDKAEQLQEEIEQEPIRSQANYERYWQRVANRQAGVEGMWLSAKDSLHDIVAEFDRLPMFDPLPGPSRWK